jgi:hypothetical protein
MRRLRMAGGLLAIAVALHAHEGGQRNLKPTKASKDLKEAKEKMAAAKKKLAEQGHYSCCVRPSCNLCARVNGGCNCAANVAKGLGACGECYAGWQAGRGAVKGVAAKSVKLLPANQQASPSAVPNAVPNNDAPPPELKEATDALIRAKRTLVSEKRFLCCTRGGCDQCAHEAECPCGTDLAKATPEYYKIAGIQPPKTPAGGVCGDCLDGWHSGQGSFVGIPLSEVKLAPPMSMSAMDESMGTATGWYSSGTSLVPKSAPMEMLSRRFHGWDLMFHGVAFAVYTDQSGPRGRDKFFSANWFMPMASHRLGPGTFTLRAMLSLEPATVTNRRYPELFQEGETAYGIPILNGQHPHDLFMELAASYQLRLGEKTSLSLYGGPRGEPALGPSAYPHRMSASEDPLAALGHHQQDSTHISNNVATLGFTHGPVTIEASGFHGREPDEKRWGLEGGAIDSFATRLTVSPTSRWTGQFSIGRINNREFIDKVRDTLRTTASVTYVRPLATGHWATTAVWGRNNDLEFTHPPTPGLTPLTAALSVAPPNPVDHVLFVPARLPRQIYTSYLLESTLFLKNKHWIWGRAENADRDGLLLYEEAPFVQFVDERRYARVQAYTAGYGHELPLVAPWLSTSLGGQFTWYGVPKVFQPVYGERPVSAQVFLRVRVAPAPR